MFAALFCPYVCKQEAVLWTARATSRQADPPTSPLRLLAGWHLSFIHTRSHTCTVTRVVRSSRGKLLIGLFLLTHSHAHT